MDQKVIDYIQQGLAAGHDIEALKQKLAEAGHAQGVINEAVEHIRGGRGVHGASSGQASPESDVEDSPGLFKKLALVITSPNELFARTRNEGILPALLYEVVLLSLVVGAISLFIFVMVLGLMGGLYSLIPELSGFGVLAGGSIIIFVLVVLVFWSGLAVAGGFVWAAVMHLCVHLMGGRSGGFAGTYKAYVYGGTPATILGVIPLLNIAAAVWSFVLVIFALSSYHSLTKMRAFLAILIPMAVIVTFVLLIVGVNLLVYGLS